MSKYIEVNDSNKEILDEGIVMVDFWAPWCGPCRMLAPVIDKLATQYEGRAKICKVNTDDAQEMSIKFGIRSIPSVIFMKDGVIQGELNVGVKPVDFYIETLDNLIK